MFVSWNATPRSRAEALRRGSVSEDFRREESEDAGHAMTVELERGEIEVTRLLQVHRHAVDDRRELVRRQRKLANHGNQRLRHRMLRRAVECARNLLPPPCKLDARHTRIGHLVHDVVDLAAKCVERRDGAAPWRGQKQEALVEARVALRGLL
jgi:hypothetical protein